MKKHRYGAWWVLGAVALLSGIGVTRAATADSPTIPREKDGVVADRKLAGPEQAHLAVPEGSWLGGPGVIEPIDRERSLSLAVPGTVAAIHVKEGDDVAAGAVLLELDAAVERSALAAAEADRAVAEAELARTSNGNRREDRDAAQAEVRAARARAELAAGVAERLTAAARGGGATRDEVERAARQADADRASAELADARARASISGSRVEDVLAGRARLETARARVAEAEARLAQGTLRAPMAGRVLQLKARAGEYHQPGSGALVVLGDVSELRARVDIDERDVGRLAVGAKVLLRAPAFPGRELSGTVLEVGRRMGRKNVRTDDPVERNDTKILEVVTSVEAGAPFVVGQRVTAYVAVTPP